MSDQNKIQFLEKKEDNSSPEKKEATSEKTLEQVSQEQKAKKLVNKDNGLISSHAISSAMTGQVKDEGGPSKYIKIDTSNTIWDNSKTEKAAEEIDNKTKTQQEKEVIFSNKREKEEKRMAEMAESLKSTIQEKSSSITQSGVFQNSKYINSTNGMSIFDEKDFPRIEEKTAGEKLSDDIRNKRDQVDESWKNGKQSVSPKDITQKMFDNFFTK